MRAFAGTDRFVVVRQLGEGGMGVVYEALDRSRGERVALKALRQVDATGIQRFKHEFRALADLAHANLVSLYELISAGDHWFFTMELLDGRGFIDHVRPAADHGAAPSPDTMASTETTTTPMLWRDDAAPRGAVTPSVASGERGRAVADQTPLFDEVRLRAALVQLASGLCALHDQAMIHRDIKPSNVMVTAAGRVVLLDFGLVASFDAEADQDSSQQVLVGTPAYMSPEQFAQKALTPASDWYSVGLMLYKALTGVVPHVESGEWLEIAMERQLVEPEPPRSLQPSAPADLSALCVELLRIDPKARPDGVEVLRKLGVAAFAGRPREPARSAARPSSKRAPLVGREAELEALNAAFVRARAGEAMTVTVLGRSGNGKTALVQRFLDDLEREASPVILRGRCFARESVPYKALDTLLESLVQHLLSRGAEEVQRLMPLRSWTLARVFPAFERASALTSAPAPAEQIPDPRELRLRAFAALHELFVRMTEGRAVVLAIDDVQWGDVDSAELLRHVLRGPAPPPILLVLGCRAEDRRTSPFLGALFAGRDGSIDASVKDIKVGTLEPEAAVQLARSLQPHLDGALAAAVARESRGNPFVIAAAMRYLAHDLGDLGAVIGPQVSMEQLLRDRLLRLPDGARRLLEVMAIASCPLPETIVGAAADLPEGLREGLRELRRAGVIRGSIRGDTALVETFHDRIREAVLAQIDPVAARMSHHRLALTLEAAGGADPEVLAVHFGAAEQRGRAGAYAALAADQAARALAFDRAVRLYRLALELGSLDVASRRDLTVALGDALTNAGRGPEAAEAYLVAADGAEAALARALRSRAGGQLLLSGHIDRGFSVLREVLGGIGMKMPPTRRRALVSIIARRARLRLRGLGFERRSADAVPPLELERIDTCWPIGLYLSSVDPVRGAYFHLTNLTLSLESGEPSRVARALCVETGYAAAAGRGAIGRTQALLDTAGGLVEELKQPYLTALHTLCQGIAAFMAEEGWAKATELCTRSEHLFRERCQGVTWELSSSQFFALNALLMRGRLGELKTRLPAAIKSAQEHGDLFAESFLRLRFLSLVRLADDDPRGAMDQLSILDDHLSTGDYFLQHYWRLYAEVQLFLYEGRAGAAWDHMSSLWANLERSQLLRMQFHRIEAAHLRARVALAAAAGRSDAEAKALLQVAATDAELLEGEATPRSRSLSWLVRAAIEARRGRRAKVDDLLARAAVDFDVADMGLLGAVTRRRRAALVGRAVDSRLAESGDGFMEQQGVRNRERMTALLAPGFQD